MRNVKVNKNELMQILVNNRIEHLAKYDEAVEDYVLLALKVSKDNLKLAKQCDLDQLKKTKSLPPAPVSYEESYNRNIRMLELSVDETIELEEQLFNQLVLDEWSWKNAFTASTLSYKAV